MMKFFELMDFIIQDPNGIVRDLVLALLALTVIVSLVFVVLRQVELYRRNRIIQEISRIESYNDKEFRLR